jgi:peptide deformylase
MLRVMRACGGLGLAAEQVGRTEAVCVIGIPPDAQAGSGAPAVEVPMPLVLINPVITVFEGEQVGQEGCLSFPEIYIDLKRAHTVEVNYMDLSGRPASARVSGLAARAVQHEVDHLNAILLVDRMSPVQKVALAGKLKRLKKETKAAAA